MHLVSQTVSACRHTLTASLSTMYNFPLNFPLFGFVPNNFIILSMTRTHTDHMLGGQCKSSSLQVYMSYIVNALYNPKPATLMNVHSPPMKAFLNLSITFIFFNIPMKHSNLLLNRVPVESLLVNRFFSWGFST